jgi:hypothetical protein
MESILVYEWIFCDSSYIIVPIVTEQDDNVTDVTDTNVAATWMEWLRNPFAKVSAK